MGNPKFIPTQKKVTYSFRVEEDKLEKLKKIAELNNIKLPKLMSHIIEDYLVEKIVYNDYLEDFEGMFIDLPDITQGEAYNEMQGSYFVSDITLEYEIKKIPNNLDKWDSLFLTFKSPSQFYSHEGLEFLIVPELCEYEGKLYQDLTQYLYCIYFTIDKKTSEVNMEYISFIDSINKLKKSENYLLLNHALNLKDKLEKSSEKIRSHISQVGDDEYEFEYIWTELRRIAKNFNSGNIIPIEKSKTDIKYKASLQSLSNIEKDNILKENAKMKKRLDQLESILNSEEVSNLLKRLDELEEEYKKNFNVNEEDSEEEIRKKLSDLYGK